MEDNIDFFHFKGELVDRDNFDSESKDLNKYVKEYIGQYESSSRARNYVGISNGNFVSFFSLSASTLKTNEKEKNTVGLPKNEELPTVKIGRLAVDKKYSKRGYGEKTLHKAISIFINLSKNVGAIGLTVDSKTNAVGYYKKYGFDILCKDGNNTSMILYTSLLQKKQPSLFESPV